MPNSSTIHLQILHTHEIKLTDIYEREINKITTGILQFHCSNIDIQGVSTWDDFQSLCNAMKRSRDRWAQEKNLLPGHTYFNPILLANWSG